MSYTAITEELPLDPLGYFCCYANCAETQLEANKGLILRLKHAQKQCDERSQAIGKELARLREECRDQL